MHPNQHTTIEECVAKELGIPGHVVHVVHQVEHRLNVPDMKFNSPFHLAFSSESKWNSEAQSNENKRRAQFE